MTRQEQIKQQAKMLCNTMLPEEYFIMGAEWAYRHPLWTSVEDDLPPRKKVFNYLSINVLATDGNEIYKSFYDYSIGGWFDDNLFRLDNITHWMPLPQQPEKLSSLERNGKN